MGAMLSVCAYSRPVSCAARGIERIAALYAAAAAASSTARRSVLTLAGH